MTATAFLWGKLPAHGDFVARGLTAERQEKLDHWLSAGLAAGRERLGASFEDCYDQAPPWRFAWPSDGGWSAGALAPSMDSVGRRYPILVGREGIAKDEAGQVAAACEDALFTAIGEGWTADRLVDSLPSLDTSDLIDPDWPAGSNWWTLGSEHVAPVTLAGEQPSALIDRLLERKAEAQA